MTAQEGPGKKDQTRGSVLTTRERPEDASFRRAGADVLTTNSYAVVPFHIGDERFAKDGFSLARLASEIARASADAASPRPVRVAGSLPPACGSYSPDKFDAVASKR